MQQTSPPSVPTHPMPLLTQAYFSSLLPRFCIKLYRRLQGRNGCWAEIANEIRDEDDTHPGRKAAVVAAVARTRREMGT